MSRAILASFFIVSLAVGCLCRSQQPVISSAYTASVSAPDAGATYTIYADGPSNRYLVGTTTEAGNDNTLCIANQTQVTWRYVLTERATA